MSAADNLKPKWRVSARFVRRIVEKGRSVPVHGDAAPDYSAAAAMWTGTMGPAGLRIHARASHSMPAVKAA